MLTLFSLPGTWRSCAVIEYIPSLRTAGVGVLEEYVLSLVLKFVPCPP
jgi:hypothetical protein